MFLSTKNLPYLALLIIMLVLIFQSTLSIFFPLEEDSAMKNVDVVLRTTLSSIFGYIMSTIFISDKDKKVKNSETKQVQTDFSKMSETAKLKRRTSIFLISGICIYSIIILVTVRYLSAYTQINSSTTATLTQFRDFISGGVGALIGLSRDSAENGS